MIAEFIDPGDSRWKETLTRARHDFYHLPEYLVFASKHEGGIPAAFYAENNDARFLAPLLIRKIPTTLNAPGDWYDATAPYGYAAPIIVPSGDADSLRRFLGAFREVGVSRRIVTAFFRLHPLLAIPNEPLTEYGTLFKHGQTVHVDLSLPFEEIWTQMRDNHRRNIRKLTRIGFHARLDDWAMYPEFVDIYREAMERLSASEFYVFSDQYFGELRTSLGDRLHLCTVMSPQGEVAAGGLFVAIDHLVQYHLGATREKYLSVAPTKLMFNVVARWGKESGNEVLHLGGGLGCRSDSLFNFKAGFSKLRSDFYTYRMVLDKARYRILIRLWRDKYRRADDEELEYFPTYRYECTK